MAGGEHPQQDCPHMSTVSVQGLAVREAGGDRCATVAINCLPSQPGKGFLAGQSRSVSWPPETSVSLPGTPSRRIAFVLCRKSCIFPHA
jgi:hypothetical protein